MELERGVESGGIKKVQTTHTCADSDERRQSALVERKRPLILPDLGAAVESAGVLLRRLKTDLDDIFRVISV